MNLIEWNETHADSKAAVVTGKNLDAKLAHLCKQGDDAVMRVSHIMAHAGSVAAEHGNFNVFTRYCEAAGAVHQRATNVQRDKGTVIARGASAKATKEYLSAFGIEWAKKEKGKPARFVAGEGWDAQAFATAFEPDWHTAAPDVQPPPAEFDVLKKATQLVRGARKAGITESDIVDAIAKAIEDTREAK